MDLIFSDKKSAKHLTFPLDTFEHVQTRARLLAFTSLRVDQCQLLLIDFNNPIIRYRVAAGEQGHHQSIGTGQRHSRANCWAAEPCRLPKACN